MGRISWHTDQDIIWTSDDMIISETNTMQRIQEDCRVDKNQRNRIYDEIESRMIKYSGFSKMG